MSVKTTLPFTYGSLDTELSLHQLTTQEKEVLRKREKNNDTNRVQVCVCTLGPVYQDPGCTEANRRLAPQRKILNTHTPFLPFSYHSLPSLPPPAFILCFSFGLISCRVSFRVAVTIDTRRGKKPVERKKRERKTLCST